MGQSLGILASEVGVSERTLRRGVGSGLVRARRPSARRLVLSDDELAWVRRNWPLVAGLRGILRTEPNVALAVLFGSVARGEEVAGASDLDLLVELRRPTPGALETLRRRLSERLPVEMQVVPMEAARRNPRLLRGALRDGRPLVDRDRAWPGLLAESAYVRARADESERRSRSQARAALGYFQQLARARARTSAGPGD